MVLPPCNVLHPCKKNVEERSFSNGNVYDVTCLHTVTGGGMGSCRPTARFGKSVQVMCGIGLGRFSPAASVTQERRWRSRLSSEGVFGAVFRSLSRLPKIFSKYLLTNRKNGCILNS